MVSYPLERLIDVSPALFAVTNATGILLSARGAWRDILGRDPEALLGRHFECIVHPDDLERVREAHAAAHRTQRSARIEVRNLHADGSFRWISWTAPPPLDGVGMAFGIDITADRQRIVEADAARAELESLLQTVPFYVTRTDLTGLIQYINRTYPGVTREQVVGTHLLNWLPPEHREPMQGAIEKVAQRGELAEFLGQGSGAGGTRWYRSRLGPVLREGQAVGVIIVGEDITDAKRAEERAVRASRLEAMGQLAGSIAHDFNNALTVIVAALDALDAELSPLPEASRGWLDLLHSAVKRLSDMTRGLVRAVRGEPECAQTLDLVAGVRGLQGMLDLATGDGIELRFALGVERASVALAAHELQQLLVNLVVNAREAMGANGIIEIGVNTVTLTAESESFLDPGEYVRLTVGDDGPGIPMALRERVVEPFFTTKAQGSGFGLATSLAMVRARMGDLRIGDSPLGGAEVEVLLPRLDLKERRADVVAETRTQARALVVLLAEDNEAARLSIARSLRRVGHTVLEARDGQDALEVLGRHPSQVDVLLSDLAMPRLDGLALVTELRKRWPRLPALLISGHCEPPLRRQLEQLGVELLDKPVSPVQLARALQRIVSRAGEGSS